VPMMDYTLEWLAASEVEEVSFTTSCSIFGLFAQV